MKAVLFDLDGVITSERIYWNCSGLALAKALGREVPKDPKKKISLAQKLLPDEVIRGFKKAGVNSNWDIAYAVSILETSGKDVGAFLKELNRRGLKGIEYLKLLDEFDPSEKHDREGGSWKGAHKRFQACYYDLMDTDEPVVPLGRIKKALGELREMGLKLGIVTGRPYDEAILPLKRWGIWDMFEPGLIVTETEVSKESEKRGEHLGKPNPYPILRAIFGECGARKCDPCDVKKIAKEYLLVGDSVADVLAAKNAGIPVICVKTGITGEDTLRKAGAYIVVNDIGDVPNALSGFLKQMH